MESINRPGSNVKSIGLTAILIAMMSLGLAACDSGTTAATPTTAAPIAAATTAPVSGTQEVKVELKEWAVTVGNTDLQAGHFKFNVGNSGTFGHDLVIQDASGKEMGRVDVFKTTEGPKTLEVDLPAGTYKFLCDVPGHAQKGMTTDVAVK